MLAAFQAGGIYPASNTTLKSIVRCFSNDFVWFFRQRLCIMSAPEELIFRFRIMSLISFAVISSAFAFVCNFTYVSCIQIKAQLMVSRTSCWRWSSPFVRSSVSLHDFNSNINEMRYIDDTIEVVRGKASLLHSIRAFQRSKEEND